MIGAALVFLFCALGLAGAVARARTSRAHRDGVAFMAWVAISVVIVLFALSTVIFRDAWASLYDRLYGSISSK